MDGEFYLSTLSIFLGKIRRNRIFSRNFFLDRTIALSLRYAELPPLPILLYSLFEFCPWEKRGGGARGERISILEKNYLGEY